MLTTRDFIAYRRKARFAEAVELDPLGVATYDALARYQRPLPVRPKPEVKLPLVAIATMDGSPAVEPAPATPKCICELDENCLLVRRADRYNDTRPVFHTDGTKLTPEQERDSYWHIPTWRINPLWNAYDPKLDGPYAPEKWIPEVRELARRTEATCPAPLHYPSFTQEDAPGVDVLDSFSDEKQAEMAEKADAYLARWSARDVTRDRWEGEMETYERQHAYTFEIAAKRREQLIAAIRATGRDPNSPAMVKWVRGVIDKKIEWAALHTYTNKNGRTVPAPSYCIATHEVVLRVPMVQIRLRAYCTCLKQLVGKLPPMETDEAPDTFQLPLLLEV